MERIRIPTRVKNVVAISAVTLSTAACTEAQKGDAMVPASLIVMLATIYAVSRLSSPRDGSEDDKN